MLYASKIAHAYANYRDNGTNKMIWIERAYEDFKQANDGKPFMYDSCYQILKKLPKFNISITRINTSRIQFYETPLLGTPTTPMGSINLADDSPTDIEELGERPRRRKGEKQRQKKKTRVTSLSVNAAIL